MQGNQGLQGQDGQGAPGIQGYSGWQGIQGGPGEVGGYGIQGPLGIQGYQGVQGGFGEGLQGIQGTTGIQGDLGPVGGGGTQGTQGYAGAQGDTGEQGIQGGGGIGSPGLQGPAGEPGAQGLGGDGGFQGSTGGLGPQGVQGTQGIRGDLGIQGSDGAGAQGDSGNPGAQGSTGFQGSTGDLGPQGLSGTGADSTVPGPQGVQGTTGGLGSQGTSGSSAAIDVASLHTSGLQGTAMFLTLVQGGSGARPLYGTTTPNPGGQQNLFYTANDDELTVENITVDGGLTLGGVTQTSWTGGSGSFDGTATNTVTTGKIVFNDNARLEFGTGGLDGDFYSNGSDVYMDIAHDKDLLIRHAYTSTLTRFTFDVNTGDFTAGGNVTTNSDARLKENVQTITGALDKVDSLRGVTYNKIGEERSELGLIAQEVESIIPEVVITSQKDELGTKSISYGNIVGLLVEAIKELKSEVEDLKK
jgi:hypothetical protein